MDKPHKRLEVWHRSVELTTEIYRVTSQFPPEEKFGLVSQMRRSAISIASNLAEGAARGKVEFAQFTRIAIGSVSELDTQLEIARRLNYLSEAEFNQLDQKLIKVDRMLIGLRRSILKRP